MARDTVYEEEEANEGLSFRKVGHFFKVGWLRMLICVIVAIALVSVIVLPIRFFYNSEKVGQTTIEFIYSGIEKGKNPNGGDFSSEDIIAPAVLDAAITDCNLEISPTELRKALRIESVETEEYVKLVEAAANGDTAAQNTLRTYTMYPTQFRIVLSLDEIKLSDAKTKELLDAIVKNYKEYFRNEFSVMNMFDANAYNLADDDNYEFTTVYDLYLQWLDPISDYLHTLATNQAGFTSTKENTTFSQLESELATLKMNYSLFNNYILVNNVWRKPDIARESLEAEKTEVEVKQTNLSDYIKNLTAMIETIKPNTIVTTAPNGTSTATTTTSSYPTQYYEYLSKLDDANREMLAYSNQLSNIDIRLNKLNDTAVASEETLKSAVDRLRGLQTQSAQFVAKVNNTITDFYDSTFIAQSVRSTQPPIVVRRTSDINILIIYAVAVIAGLLVGGIITGVKISKRNAKKQNKIASEPIEKPEQ